jgi:hypothetical protein
MLSTISIYIKPLLLTAMYILKYSRTSIISTNWDRGPRVVEIIEVPYKTMEKEQHLGTKEENRE